MTCMVPSPMDVACVWSSFRCPTWFYHVLGPTHAASMCDAQFLCSEPVEASWQRDSSQTGHMLLHRRARRLQSMPSLYVRLTPSVAPSSATRQLRPHRRSAFHGRRWSPPILARRPFRAAQALSIDASNSLANHTHRSRTLPISRRNDRRQTSFHLSLLVRPPTARTIAWAKDRLLPALQLSFKDRLGP